MGSKRSATSELNHDNWDEENKPEEAGVFKKAADDVLEKRVVKTARRRLPPREGSAKSAFSALAGFKTASTTNSSLFSFLSNANTTNTAASPPKTTANTTNGASKNTENGSSKKEDSLDAPTASKASTNTSEKEDEKLSKKSADYCAKLKGLNESVAQWIKTHVDANPFCILTPIFRDYERYLKEIEAKHENETDKATSAPEQAQTAPSNDSSKEIASSEKKPDSSPFGGASIKPLMGSEWKPERSIFGNINSNIKSIFGNAGQSTDTAKSVFSNTDQTVDTPKSIFGNINKSPSRDALGRVITEKKPFLNFKASSSPDNKAEEDESRLDVKSTTSTFSSSSTTTPIFSFGQSSTTTNVSAGFSFGGAKPFAFPAQAVKSQDSEDKGDNDAKEEEDEEPPKPDFKPVTEEGAVYEQRCKVFVKKDGNFSDRGVGMLFLKPTPNGKTQLIVRAEMSLGNLILNTLLTESIPTKRANKNTIMLVCLPKPESAPPPVPVLLRVKTEEEADALLETLNKYKK